MIVSDGKNKNGTVNGDGIKESFESRFSNKDGENASYIEVRVYLFNNIENTKKFYKSCCEKSWYKPDLSKFKFGGNNDDRYCLSYVEQIREAPEAFSVPSNEYKSFVCFQKKCLVIQIIEITNKRNYSKKDEIIRQVADALGKF